MSSLLTSAPVLAPVVDVVIVTYNSERDLAGCIFAVRAWDRVARVIVVDSVSGDRSVSMAGGLADTVVRMPANLGFGAAQNRGRAECTAPFVLVLNPDARVDVAGLAHGLAVLSAAADVGMVEGVVRRAADGAEERWQGPAPGVADLVARLFRMGEWLGEERLKRLARRLGAAYFAERSTPETADVEFLAAVAVLARREALDSVQGFDEAYFLYAEDVDLCSRLRRAGWRLIALPTPWATHVGGASSEGTGPLRHRRWWESHRLLVRRQWSGPRRALGLALTGTGLAVARLSENGRPWISRPA